MRAARVGTLLLGLGVVVGAVASIGLLVGFEPARLPRELLNIAAYKLTFVTALGLLAAGAIAVRYGRRETPDDQAARLPTSEAALPEGQSMGGGLREARSPERVRTESRTENGRD